MLGMRVRRAFAFLDLSGFTALTANEGDERSVAVLEQFRGALRRTCSRRGVRIAKWLGDGAMLVGIEPTPLICAALETMWVRERDDAQVAVKCGMTTGPVILLEGDDYIGHAVNLAARLCELAVGGQALAHPSLEGFLPPWAKSGERRRVTVRGVPEPLEIVELSLHCPGTSASADPICGLPLVEATSVAWRSGGAIGRWLFCSDSCLETWESRAADDSGDDEAFVRDGIA
jgi:adenylate cyclase